jgi:hypothetical protein
VDMPGQLASDVAALFDGFGSDDHDVHGQLGAVRAALTLAVPSYCSLALRLVVSGIPVTLEIVEAAVTVAAETSLFLPLEGQGFGSGSSLTIFAAVPGTLVDLAADLAFALGLGDRVVLDGHREMAPVDSGLRGVAELSRISQAVGVLIAHGYEPDDARALLRDVAGRQRQTELAVAEEVVAGARGSQPCAGLG